MNKFYGGFIMPAIRKSADLRNNKELYQLIQEGIDDIENGKTLTEDEILKNMEIALGK
jgi:predicted transcriptional regulator